MLVFCQFQRIFQFYHILQHIDFEFYDSPNTNIFIERRHSTFWSNLNGKRISDSRRH
jgi:hypothetical protein